VRTKTLSTRLALVGLLPLGLALSGVAATFAASRWVAERQAIEIRERTQSEARHIAAQLLVGISHTFDHLQRLAGWWLSQGKPMASEDWQNDAQLFLTPKEGLREVIWLDAQGLGVWTVRPGGAPQSHPGGPPDPVLAATMAAALKANDHSVSPVFGAGDDVLVYACTPVYRSGRLAGYAAGLYDARRLTAAALEGQRPEEYSVAVIADGRRLEGSDSGRQEFVRSATLSLGRGAWKVNVAPDSAIESPLRRSVIVFGLLISALLWGCAALMGIARWRARELQVENEERQRAEEQVAHLNRDLQRRLDEFQTLLDVLPIGIAITDDPECRRVWSNRALAGMLHVPQGPKAPHPAPGGQEPPPYRMLRQGTEVPPEELPMQLAARTGAPVADSDLDIVRDDGVVLHTVSYAAPLFDENGKVRGVIDACVDITKRKQLEARLQNAEKFHSLAMMAGGMAHDFNNLLTVIIGQTGAAIEATAGGPAARALGEAQAAAARAAELVAKLLAFTGRSWRATAPVALSAEIEDLMPSLREMVPAAVPIRCALEPDLPLVEGGSSELRQVLLALAANAGEAMETVEGGEIEIRTSRRDLSAEDLARGYADEKLQPGLYVCVEVRDSGCGIPKELQRRVFEPFFTTKFVGRGLGLSAAQGIVRAHGGAIRLRSSPREGTTAEVLLPACLPPEPSRRAKATAD
jgi:signal transduction histidine kinase